MHSKCQKIFVSKINVFVRCFQSVVYWYIDLVTNCNKVQCWLLFSVLMFHPIAMIHYCNSTCVTLPIRISTANSWIPVSAHMPIKATKFSLYLWQFPLPGFSSFLLNFSQLNVNDHPPASCFKILKWGLSIKFAWPNRDKCDIP